MLARDAPALSGDARQNRIARLRLYRALRGLHRAGSVGKLHLHFALEFARDDVPRIGAELVQISGNAAGAIQARRREAQVELGGLPCRADPTS